MALDTRGFRFRFAAAMWLLGCLVLIVVGRYAWLMLSPRDPVPGRPSRVERGPIVDRNGRLMAVAASRFDVGVWRPDIPGGLPAEDLSDLASLLGMEGSQLAQKIADSPTDFLFLKKDVNLAVADGIRELKRSTIAVEVSGSDGKPSRREVRRMAGIVVQESPGRLYPMGSLGAHAVGFVDASNAGAGGIEYAMEDELFPPPQTGKDLVHGNQVVLTLDAGVQAVLERVAAKTLADNGAEAIMLLAADPRNGDVLGYAAFPSFDPNDIASARPDDLRNLPISYPYEPGSVFKVFSLGSIYQLGGIDATSSFFCDGSYRTAAPGGEDIKIRCLDRHGTVTLATILSLSCNAGAGYASDRVGNEAFYGMVRAFGFGERTGVGFKGEESGIFQDVGRWSLRSKPTIAMGQEILVTAMQMLQAAVAVANGGVLLKPRIVSSVVSPDGRILWENPVLPLRRVMDAPKAATVIAAMEQAASEGGTGRRAALQDIRLAVKTGTAQMVERGKKVYSEDDYIASCVGILPAQDPRLVIYLVIVKPRGSSYYGGRIAAPVVGQVADELAQLLGIGRAGQTVVAHPGSVSIPAASLAEIGDRMPDLRGLPKRSLVPLLARTDILVTIRGSGYVVWQTPDPGTAIAPGARIVLELR